MIRTAIAEEGFCRYNFGPGTDADTFTVEVGTPVPEPSTWAMMLIGFAGLGLAAKGRRAIGFLVGKA